MYLISTQGLIDLIGGDPDIGQLLRQLGADRVRVSIVTLGVVEADLQSMANEPDFAQFDQALRSFEAFARRMGCIEPFDGHVVRVWARLLNQHLTTETDDDGVEDLGDIDRMVVATAIERNLILIDRPRIYHQQLALNAHGY